ncbi:hypothetical protein [Arthrobacter oryzae]|uniref:hypothetical protein n=1 Tax=Arthrobacter oryzae TaxID=409290 RepID=UPI002865EBDF|nr:hypothetical protein [Arthrobacter oryzae]MDR6505079.1 hypothetical protein [Arthrobacter oryzae]
MSELAYRTTEPAGATRSRTTWDGAWSVPAMPAVMTAPAAPAPATPLPVTTDSATQASAALVSGIRAIPSLAHPNEAGHLRPAVKVPVTLSLRGLGYLAGTVSVQLTLSPVVPVTSPLQGRRPAPVTGDLLLTFSSIGMGASVATRHDLRSGTFTADFVYAATAGLTQVDFAIDGYGYCGGNKDHRDFSVTAVVTFQEHGKQAPTVLASSSLISL